MVAMTLSMIWGVKWDDIQNDILDLARRMFTAILVLIFVGMLIGVWIASGTVPILIYWGLEILTPKFFLIVVCLTCSLMSLMTGTSWGTVGTIDFAVEKIMKVAKTQRSVLLCSYAFHAFLILTIGVYYTTFSMAGPVLQPLYEKYGLDKANLSRCLEDTGTTFSPLVPWCSNGVYFTSTLNVPYSAYALTTPMCWPCVVFALIYIITGFKIKQAPKKEDGEAATV